MLAIQTIWHICFFFVVVFWETRKLSILWVEKKTLPITESMKKSKNTTEKASDKRNNVISCTAKHAVVLSYPKDPNKALFFSGEFILIFFFNISPLKHILDTHQKCLGEKLSINMFFLEKQEQEAHRPRFAHMSKSAIAYLQMSYNILPVLPQQLVRNLTVL